MFPPDFRHEIEYSFTRSGGKGGQHVNKVSTAVLGKWHVENSIVLSDEQKQTILGKLQHRITQDGFLQVKSQLHRSQLANKQEVEKSMLALVANALLVRKPRVATKPNKASKEKRLQSKKQRAEIKANRRQSWE